MLPGINMKTWTLLLVVVFWNGQLIAAKKASKPLTSFTCSEALRVIVERGQMPLQFALAVQKLIDTGPEKWIVIEGEPGIHGLVFQRGVSGALGITRKHQARSLKSGAEDAINILLGEGNVEDAHTSVLPNLVAQEKPCPGLI